MGSDSVIDFAAASYGFDKATCRFVTRGREDSKRLYTFRLLDKPYILRLVQYPFAEAGQTTAEMDWLLYLAEKGLYVPVPLRTRKGELAVSMKRDGEAYTLCAFSMGPGQKWDKDDPELWGRYVFYNWGSAVGKMHQAAKGYEPAAKGCRRNQFAIGDMMGDGITAYPVVQRKTQALLEQIDALPKERGAYGLIHNDLHPDNLLIDGQDIYLFDFDGCAYSWFAFDIGNALYLALWCGRSNNAGVDFSNDIIQYFLKGYLAANPLENYWLEKIPLFMMCCKIALFSYGCDSETPSSECEGYCRQEQQRNIEQDVLFTGCTIDQRLFQNR